MTDRRKLCGTPSIITTSDGLTNPWLDEDIQPLVLTEPEIDDLGAFLVLTSPQYKVLADKRYARQVALPSVTKIVGKRA
jgi:cytochrome c peroxidase